MSFDILALCSAVVGALFILIPLKEFKNEYFKFALAGLGVLVFVIAINAAKPLFIYLEELSKEESSFYFKILIKILGISIVTNITSELASDIGANAISGKVEFAGKVAVLLSAIPVYDRLFGLIGEVI